AAGRGAPALLALALLLLGLLLHPVGVHVEHELVAGAAAERARLDLGRALGVGYVQADVLHLAALQVDEDVLDLADVLAALVLDLLALQLARAHELLALRALRFALRSRRLPAAAGARLLADAAPVFAVHLRPLSFREAVGV